MAINVSYHWNRETLNRMISQSPLVVMTFYLKDRTNG